MGALLAVVVGVSSGMSTVVSPATDPIDTGNVPLPTLEQLPNDLDTLKRMIVELVTTLHPLSIGWR